MSESVLGIWLMALAWTGLMELGAVGGGEELVWTDHGVPNPGMEAEDEFTPALCISCAGRFGNAAPRPPDNMLPVLPLPLFMWWAMGESIWIVCGFTGEGDGDAASASASCSGEPRGSGCLCGR